jgi:hypothetical protein
MALQPVVEGIQAVGSVGITYQYNSSDHVLDIPVSFELGGTKGGQIETKTPLNLAGFRLDSEFLRASPMIATSFMTAILGGGAVALTNNIRAGTFSLNCTKCSSPILSGSDLGGFKASEDGSTTENTYYDFVFIAQCQQARPGGDSVGSTITVSFDFGNVTTELTFNSCTIASVDPVAIAGNDLPNYNVSVNYLRWSAAYKTK